MTYKLTVPFGATCGTLFLQEGFYALGQPSRNLHKHSYTEIHAVFGGEARFLIGQADYVFQSGDLFLVPANTPHTCLSCSDALVHTAFQTDTTSQTFQRHNLPAVLLEGFFTEIKKLLVGILLKISLSHKGFYQRFIRKNYLVNCICF